MKDAETEALAFYEKGNKSATTRLRQRSSANQNNCPGNPKRCNCH
ncbi:hypothetical protein [Sphingobacterium sp. ML3W]